MATRTPASSICGILVAILCIGVILAIVLTAWCKNITV